MQLIIKFGKSRKTKKFFKKSEKLENLEIFEKIFQKNPTNGKLLKNQCFKN